MLIAEMLKNLPNFCSNGYFEFSPKNLQKGVNICSPGQFSFFLVDWFPTYGRSSNF